LEESFLKECFGGSINKQKSTTNNPISRAAQSSQTTQQLLVGRFRLFAFVGALNCIVNFTAVHWHFTRGFHPQANFVTANLDYDNRNLVIDDDALVLFAR
jgi:hypothetical protein